MVSRAALAAGLALALVAAHDAALSNRSLTWRRTTRFQDEGGVVVAWGTLTLARDGSRKTLRTERGGAAPDAIPGRRPAVNYWTNGSTTVWRTERPNGSVGVRTAEGPPSGSFGDLDTGATAVASLLRGLELRYVGTTTSDGETLAVLATVDGAADVATVYVTETGVVRSVALRTTVEFDGVQLTRVVRFELSGVGETTVERPPWARNATAG